MTHSRDRLGRRLPPGSADERRYGDPELSSRSFEDALSKALELLEDARFFEAHEFFEHLWKSPDAAPDDRDFWQGLAQVAVGFCHLQRGNPRGALTLLERGLARLAPYPTPHHGIATGALRDAARATAEGLRTGAPPGSIPLPRFFRAPRS